MLAVLLVALGVEFADELADGARAAALPLIRGDLHLTYSQLGLLIAVPLLAGSLLELPLGLVAGHGQRRHRFVLAGGLVFTASLAAVAVARTFPLLLAAFVVFFPASGAFVSLTQSALMDTDPSRQQQRMAAWNLTGSFGDVAGPLLLAAVIAVGGNWRWCYLLLAAAAGLALVAAWMAGPARPARPASAAGRAHPAAAAGPDQRTSVRAAVRALRAGPAARWLALLQITDLLGDVLTGFVGVYLVDVAHAGPAKAAIGVAVRLGAGLAGDALFTAVAGRVSGRAVLYGTAAAAGLLYPAFLLVPALAAKLAILAVLSAATACWYPVCQAGLYASLPGASGIAVFWSSVAGLAGAAGPLAAGFLAAAFGLGPALACLAVTPVAVFLLVPRG